MNDNINIRRNRSDEFEDLIGLLDSSFGFPNERTEGFIKLLPKLYKKDSIYNIVAERDGELLGAVGLYERKLEICGEMLTTVGIGNVACRADMRGSGIMTRLMKKAVEEIKKSGAELSDLGGRRHRYGHFGYECAGRVYNFHVRADAVRHIGEGKMPDTVKCEPLTEYMIEAEQLYNEKNCRFVRDNFSEVIISWEARPTALIENGSFIGYAVIDGDRVSELLLRDSEKLAASVRALMVYTNEEGLSFTLHETERGLLCGMYELFDGVNVRSNEQISVMDHHRVAEVYLKLANKLNSLPDGELPLLIHGINGDECFTLRVAEGDVSTIPSAELPIELSHNEAIALLFGLYSPHRDSLPRNVASWLPLPIYIPSPDCV